MLISKVLAGLALIATVVSANASAPWRGVHVIVGSEADLDTLGAQLPALAKNGVNQVIVEVDYSFQYQSRPEMAKADGVTKDGARAFAKLCRANHIRPIPQINCLGHQSWAKETDTLLRAHPELAETPGLYPDNQGIYCRSWCPLHPDLHSVVFPLVDQLIDAFQANAFHVGMDEVFIIGTDTCPRCHGKTTAELFAKSVNDFHDHLKSKHVQMLMWGDRFLDGKATGYGEWEASQNNTFPAIDMVPKDIILCDWHYDPRTDYPSIKILTDKGFRIWPATFRDEKAATAFSTEARADKSHRVIGVLSTNWGDVKIPDLPNWPPMLDSFKPWP